MIEQKDLNGECRKIQKCYGLLFLLPFKAYIAILRLSMVGNYKGRRFLRKLRKVRVVAAARMLQKFWRQQTSLSFMKRNWTAMMKKLRILLVFSNPHRTSPLRLQSEERAIREALSGSYYEFFPLLYVFKFPTSESLIFSIFLSFPPFFSLSPYVC